MISTLTCLNAPSTRPSIVSECHIRKNWNHTGAAQKNATRRWRFSSFEATAISGSLKVLRGNFALLASLRLVRNPLALVEAANSGALDCRNMHKNVFRAVIRLDKAIALGRVEPFYGTRSHSSLSIKHGDPHAADLWNSSTGGSVERASAKRHEQPQQKSAVQVPLDHNRLLA